MAGEIQNRRGVKSKLSVVGLLIELMIDGDDESEKYLPASSWDFTYVVEWVIPWFFSVWASISRTGFPLPEIDIWLHSGYFDKS